jgi:hypothetical protein
LEGESLALRSRLQGRRVAARPAIALLIVIGPMLMRYLGRYRSVARASAPGSEPAH